jgi:hypothetical protein
MEVYDDDSAQAIADRLEWEAFAATPQGRLEIIDAEIARLEAEREEVRRAVEPPTVTVDLYTVAALSLGGCQSAA